MFYAFMLSQKYFRCKYIKMCCTLQLKAVYTVDSKIIQVKILFSPFLAIEHKESINICGTPYTKNLNYYYQFYNKYTFVLLKNACLFLLIMLSKNFATDKNESNSFERFFVRYIQNVMMGTSANKLYQFLKLSSVSN